MMQADAFIFDVFGTVLDWRSSVAAGVEHFFDNRDKSVDGHRFAMDWRSLYIPSLMALMERGDPFVKLDVLHRQNLLAVLEKHGHTGLVDDEIDELTHLWHHLRPWPDSVAGLAALRAQRPVAACSNANIAMMINMSRSAGLLWDAVLGAEIAQAYKPAPQVYLKACEALELRPENVMMVAAHNADLAAAREQRLLTAFIRRPDERGPDGNPGAEPDQDWDLVADDLLDLAQKFSGSG